VRVNTRLIIIIAASLIALIALAATSLYITRSTLQSEKREQITCCCAWRKTRWTTMPSRKPAAS
jgi:peptidoglycan/LPS O-acetylase OafA/YrhL